MFVFGSFLRITFPFVFDFFYFSAQNFTIKIEKFFYRLPWLVIGFEKAETAWKSRFSTAVFNNTAGNDEFGKFAKFSNTGKVNK